MAQLQQIIAQSGPLPIKASATIETDDPTIVTLSGSVWTPTSEVMTGIVLTIDDEQEIAAQIFSNDPNTHRAVVPVAVPYTFSIGDHAFTLAPLNANTTSDFNDYFCVTVQY